MNSVILIGNLTRDPELRYSTGANPIAICRFSIAINDGYGDKQRVDYPNIVVFGKQAENCDRYLSKGRKVAVSGRLQTGSYEKDGRKVYTTEVVANRVEFLGSSQGNQNGQYSQNSQFSQGGQFSQSPQYSQGSDSGQPQMAGPSEDQGFSDPIDVPGGFTSLQDDDIPF